ncbi:MAG: YSC84-related protein [Planctomycetota bacterium]|nr:YSC84-related protein [Planctomycetota bacterium]
MEKRDNINVMARETLERLYVENPEARQEIKAAPGYAVFEKNKVDVLLVTGGGGYGVAVDGKGGKRTYMKMGMGGVGPGIGAKDYRVVMIFPSDYIFRKFIESSWQFGGQAEATARAEGSGGDAAVSRTFADVKYYFLTEKGLLAGSTATGSKYWRYDELND